LDIPNVSVRVDIINVAGVKLEGNNTGIINFDVKAKLEEKERRSQLVIVGFNLLVMTRPAVVKFKVEGTATLTGKDEEINKILEIDPEVRVPYVFQKVYQSAFEAMYLVSAILKTPPPPHNMLLTKRAGNKSEDVEIHSEIGGTQLKEAALDVAPETSSSGTELEAAKEPVARTEDSRGTQRPTEARA